MRIWLLAVFLGISMFACVAQPEPVASTQQNVCQDDPDTCPGGHPITLRQQTEVEGRSYAAQHGYTITGTPSISCNSNGRQCRGSFYLTPSQYVFTACDSAPSGQQCCSSSLCTNDSNGNTTGCTGETPQTCSAGNLVEQSAAAAPPPETNICRDDSDRCPGGHPLTPQQMHDLTDDYATQSAGGATPINESWSLCSGHYCAVRWEFSWGVITTACIDHQDGNGAHCASVSCTGGPSCSPQPPLPTEPA